MTRKKKLLYNTIVSLAYQLITLVCGFILPRFFLSCYGSAVNGLVSSITQFLGFVALAECGVGAVVQSTLYKPLADKDNAEVSRIMKSSQRFFRRIAIILIIYTAFLMVFYPFVTRERFDFSYTMGLIFIISISSFAQYFFSMSYRLLLDADQMSFIQLGLQGATMLLNTVFSVILMKMGAGIHLVKLATATVFLIQPVALNAYVKRHYSLDKKIKLEGEPIKQKWNGLAQHIAAVVLGNTDTVVLTLFSTLENVSIYAVYHLVVNGVKQILNSLTAGVQSMFGYMMHLLVAFSFSCTAVLILPFVNIYTKEISDANYIVPAFSLLISAAQASYCLRLPYNMMVLAAGHYRQTQWSAIIEAMINIIVSVVLVRRFGLVGVAVGTLAAMLYRTTYLAWYLSKDILNRSMKYFFKHIVVDAACAVLTLYITKGISLVGISYVAWIIMALKVAVTALAVNLAINCVLYPNYIKALFRMVFGFVKSLRSKIVNMFGKSKEELNVSSKEHIRKE